MARRISELQAVVAARQRAFGDEHPDTLKARVELALGYRDRGRDRDAVDTLEDVVAVCDCILGQRIMSASVTSRSAACRRHDRFRVDDQSGPPGTRTLNLRIKSPQLCH
jgi:hypothetical protein